MPRFSVRAGVGVLCVASVALAVVGRATALGSGAVAAAPAAGSTACQARVAARVLPDWARTGFSETKPRMPYVLGTRGKIMAILWADPLLSPPPTTHNNKILWVSRRASTPGSPLKISARRVVDSTAVGPTVSRSVPDGPGPSIINLPASGCWHLTLRWSGRTDTLDVRYLLNRSVSR